MKIYKAMKKLATTLLIIIGLTSCLKLDSSKDYAKFLYNNETVRTSKVSIKESLENGLKTAKLTIRLNELKDSTAQTLLITFTSPEKIGPGWYYVGDSEYPLTAKAKIIYKGGTEVESHLGYVYIDSIEDGMTGSFQFFFMDIKNKKEIYIEDGQFAIH